MKGRIPVTEVITPAGVFRFEPGEPGNGKASTIRFSDKAGQTRWTHPVGDDRDAYLIAAGDALYAALYSATATGCRVLALEVSSGRERWHTRLAGIGSMMHSRYRNTVQMKLTGQLSILGDEGGGQYVEVLDPATGNRLSHTRIDP